MFEEIIISGGGVKGIAIVGALEHFSNYFLISKIKTFVGSSVGSLISLMVIIGYSFEELRELFIGLDFTIFRKLKFSEFFENYGLDDGSKMTNLIKAMMILKKFDPGISFENFQKKTGKNLVITGTNITKGKIIYFNAENHPNMMVLTAVRISIGFPFMYTPIKLDNDFYTDGGVLSPYPMDYLCNSNKKIGFLLTDHIFINKCSEKTNEITNVEEYCYSLLNVVINSYLEKCLIGFEKETVYININDINCMKFNLSTDAKKKLYDVGKESFEKYVNYYFLKARQKFLLNKYGKIWLMKIRN